MQTGISFYTEQKKAEKTDLESFDMVLEEIGEDQIDAQSEKPGSAAKIRGRKDHIRLYFHRKAN